MECRWVKGRDMSADQDVLQELPLTEATFFILLSLSSGKKHGYAIMKDVEQLSGERICLGTGTLYGALGRLLDQGWIERIEEEQDTRRPRKAYVLSELGRRILLAETVRLQKNLSSAQQRLARGTL
jgi:DNA-binding PadR family transcriptional regulator